jgi:Rv0078B-related antitoxin
MSSASAPDARDRAAARLRTALDLFETGVEMMRQKLRRDHPGLADHEIEAQVRAWLREGPGAEFGDAVGRRVAWPRRSE